MRKLYIIGADHTSDTVYQQLIELFKHLLAQNKTCAFLAEEPPQQSLREIIRTIQEEIDILETQAQKTGIATLYSQNENGQKVLAEDKYELVKTILRLIYPQHNDTVLTYLTVSFYKIQAMIKNLELYTILENSNVDFLGIDPFMGTKDSVDEVGRYTRELEQSRCEEMAKRINTYLKENPKTEAIFVLTGNLHTRHIAANLAKKQPANVNVHSIICDGFKKNNNISAAQLEALFMGEADSVDSIHSLQISAVDLERTILELSSKSPDPKLSPSHQSFVKEIIEYLNKSKTVVSNGFMKMIEETKYNQALRCACHWGLLDLVKIFVRYKETLAINFQETSMNGNTPAKWFAASKASNEEKQEAASLLELKSGQEESEEVKPEFVPVEEEEEASFCYIL